MTSGILREAGKSKKQYSASDIQCQTSATELAVDGTFGFL